MSPFELLPLRQVPNRFLGTTPFLGPRFARTPHMQFETSDFTKPNGSFALDRDGQISRKYRKVGTGIVVGDSAPGAFEREVWVGAQTRSSSERSKLRGTSASISLTRSRPMVMGIVSGSWRRCLADCEDISGRGIFTPHHSEIIRKGKAGKPNEFGKLVELQEAENQIITHYEVFEVRPSDRHLLLPAVEAHRRKLGRVPGWVAADAGFYSRANEEAAPALGVKYVSIPNRSTRSEERRKLEKQRWFKRGQKWRMGCEGRISVIKRRHGLARCRYHGLHGMRRWVGLGVIADNLINIGRHLAPQPA